MTITMLRKASGNTFQEIALVTKLLPTGKSPGHDGILYEHIIRAKQPIDMAFTALFILRKYEANEKLVS